MNFNQLERSVRAFNAHPVGLERPLFFSSLPIIEDAYVPQALPIVRTGTKKKTGTETAVDIVDPASVLYKVQEFSHLGY